VYVGIKVAVARVSTIADGLAAGASPVLAAGC
jgi:hypothetical protein